MVTVGIRDVHINNKEESSSCEFSDCQSLNMKIVPKYGVDFSWLIQREMLFIHKMNAEYLHDFIGPLAAWDKGNMVYI